PVVVGLADGQREQRIQVVAGDEGQAGGRVEHRDVDALQVHAHHLGLGVVIALDGEGEAIGVVQPRCREELGGVRRAAADALSVLLQIGVRRRQPIDDDRAGRSTAGAAVQCHGYTGIKDLYLPDNARTLAQAGYVVMTFDYKGWGESAGPRSRLAPYSRVADVQAAMTFLGTLPEVDAERIGLYGTSYGG